MKAPYATAINLFNESRKDSTVRVTPRWALVCSDINALSQDRSTPSGLFTTHDISTASNGDFRLSAGHPADRADALDLLARLAGQSMAFLPENVIAYGPQGFAWTAPAAVRPMRFRVGKTSLRFRVPWPELLFVAGEGSLGVYARQQGGRPKANEPLFHAPLANIFDDGGLCWGTIKPPRLSLKSLNEYEHAVFATNFTEANHRKVIRDYDDKKGIHSFWRGLQDRAAFPVDALCAFGRTVGQVCHA
jgi:PRTRC genetic system protein B